MSLQSFKVTKFHGKLKLYVYFPCYSYGNIQHIVQWRHYRIKAQYFSSHIYDSHNNVTTPFKDASIPNISMINDQSTIDPSNIQTILLKTIKHVSEKSLEISKHITNDDRFGNDLQYLKDQPGLFLSQLQLEENNSSRLFLRQLAIEDELVENENQQYHDSVKKLFEMGQATSLKFVQKYVLKWYTPLCESINAEIQLLKSPDYKVKNKEELSILLMLLPIDDLAIITLDLLLSSILRSNNHHTFLADLSIRIGDVIENEVSLIKLKFKKNDLSYWDNLILKQAKISKQFSLTIQGKLSKLLYEEKWTETTKARLGSILLKLLINSAKDDDNMLVFYRENIYDPKNKKTRSIIIMNENVYNSISNRNRYFSQPKYLPMLTIPRQWDITKKGFGSCYHRLQCDIMRTFSKLHELALQKANMKPVIDGLNFLGQQPWRINKSLLSVVQEAWRRKLSIGSIPLQDDLIKPEKKEFYRMIENPLDGTKSLQLDEVRYQDALKKVKKKNNELHSLRCDFLIKLNIAQRFQNDTIYFPWNIDFRGRSYPVPPNLSHLGNDMSRGLLLFDEAKPLGRNGLYWLKIHLANLYGNNKISLENRVQWTNDNLENIYDSVKNPLDGKLWWTHGDEPFQILACCFEIVQAIDSGDPSSYLCRLSIHQDGSCNGLQHYAALGRDSLGGAAVNVIPTNGCEIPQDVYTRVLEIVMKKIHIDIEIPNNVEDIYANWEKFQSYLSLSKKESIDFKVIDPVTGNTKYIVPPVEKYFKKVLANGKSARFVKDFVNRKVIKQSVMTSVYGVTAIGARAQVQARLLEKIYPDPTHILSKEEENDIYNTSIYVADLILKSLVEMFSSAKAIMDWFAQCAALVAKHGHVMSWITPLGLPVMQPYREVKRQQISSSLNFITLAIHNDALPVLGRKQRSAFSPNFVHSLDATHMLMTALKMKDKGLSYTAVHDSFWTHPCDVEVLNDLLRDSFVELYEKPILEDFRESLIIRYPQINFPTLPSRGNLCIQDVKKSTFFFH